jgi:hypothetical protein
MQGLPRQKTKLLTQENQKQGLKSLSDDFLVYKIST